MQRLIKNTLKLFSTNLQVHQQVAPLDFNNIDLEDYRDLDQPIKQHTGLSLIQVEPFPRLKLMQLCIQLLQNIKKFPQDCTFRMFHEEKYKWIMETVHEEKDVTTLEEIFDTDAIELFIEDLADEMEVQELSYGTKIWEDSSTEQEKMIIQASVKRPEEFLEFYRIQTEQNKALLEKEFEVEKIAEHVQKDQKKLDN